MAYYNISKVLKFKRKALGLVKEEFEVKATSAMTVYRVEHGKNITTEKTYRRMTHKMGNEESLRQGILKPDKITTLLLRNEIVRETTKKKFEKAEQLLEQFNESLDKKIPRNKQYYLWKKVVLDLRLKRISASECEGKLREAIALTIPEFDRIDIGEWAFRIQELEILFSLNQALRAQKKYIEQLDLLEKIERSIDLGYMDDQCTTKQKILVLYSLGDVLGNLGRYQEAIEKTDEGIRLSIECGEVTFLSNLYYSKHWDLWMLGKENELGKEQEEECKRCLLLACHLCITIERSSNFYEVKCKERYPELLPYL